MPALFSMCLDTAAIFHLNLFNGCNCCHCDIFTMIAFWISKKQYMYLLLWQCVAGGWSFLVFARAVARLFREERWGESMSSHAQN